MTAAAHPSHFGTLNDQGRVVIPAEVRRALGLNAGDRVEFLVEDGSVRLVTPRMRAMRVWAKNHGGDGGDSTADMRAQRTADQEADAAAERRTAARVAADTRSEAQIASELLAGLGL